MKMLTCTTPTVTCQGDDGAVRRSVCSVFLCVFRSFMASMVKANCSKPS